jgi:hypothetical protein
MRQMAVLRLSVELGHFSPIQSNVMVRKKHTIPGYRSPIEIVPTLSPSDKQSGI